MRVQIQRGGIFTAPQNVDDADSIVIMTAEGHPVVIAMDLDGNVVVQTADDGEEFTVAASRLNLNTDNLAEFKHIDLQSK